MHRSRKARRQPLSPATALLLKQCLIGLGLFASLALIITSIWHVSRLETFTIREVKAVGGATIDSMVVVGAVDQLLEGSYLRLIPRRFSFFYPHEEIVEAVSRISRIKDVTIARTDLQTLTVTYGEYVPDGLWCQEAEGDCFFLDETGYAFGPAPELDGGSLLRYLSLQDTPTTGSRPVSLEEYSYVKTFAEMLAATGWFIETVEVDAVRDVFYTLSGGGEIKATLKNPPEKTISYLTTIRESEEFSHLAPGNFQYVDLRFGTKVFVNETSLDLATTTATSTEAEFVAEDTSPAIEAEVE